MVFFRSGFKIEGQNGERGLLRELKSVMKVFVGIFTKSLYKYIWSPWYTQCDSMFEYYFTSATEWVIWRHHIEFLHIPGFIIAVIFFRCANCRRSTNDKGKDNEFWYNFFYNLSMFEPCKWSEDNFNYVVNRKFSICYNINILYRFWEQSMLFSF